MTIRYLHLSDLHITDGKNKNAVEPFNRKMVVDSMLTMIGKSESKLDFIVITGDIAKTGKPEEYEACEVFIDELLSAAGLGRDRLFLVPGNHDVDRDKVKPNHIKRWYVFDNQEEINEILLDEDMRPVIMKKLNNFNAFAGKAMGRSLLNSSKFRYTETLSLEKNGRSRLVNIVGLNSCLFAGYKDDDRQKLALGLCQVNPALESLNKEADLSVGLFHHPFRCFHPGDQTCENMLIKRLDLILTGHMHKATNAFTRSAAGRSVIIGAGAGFEKRDGYNSFNIADIDPETGEGVVRYFKYLPDHNRWKKDTDINPDNDEGVFRFSVKPAKVRKQAPRPDEIPHEIKDPKKKELGKEIEDYCRNAVALHKKMPLAGFRTRLKVPVRVEDIYVPLRAMIDLRTVGKSCFADAEDAEKHLRECGDNEISVPDAFSAAARLNRRGIVILGDPGSGKTTHLKRLLLWCLKGGLENIGLPEDVIPVFLPLRELRDLDKSLDAFVQSQLDQPHLKTPEGFGKRLLERGNLLFLLDGLDEVVEAGRRSKVSKWIDGAAAIYKDCYFAVTCRFAGYTDESRLSGDFLEMHMRPLSAAQAEAFVRNWYRIVETSVAGLSSDPDQAEIIADERAEKLIRRLEQPEFRARRVLELTRNPLLLTNICLVHHARGNLPHTRADLYDECTDVLLELWRDAAGVKTKVTAKTGRRVLQPAALWLHGEEGRTRAGAHELAPVIDPVLKDVGWRFGSAREFLRAVRDESGLLTGWDGDNYGFMHLGFQEYLAAREIRSRAFGDPAILKELAGKFGESWWQEVILLMLALEDPSLFEPFMHEVVRLSVFAENPEMAGMCLNDSVETPSAPFVELVRKKPGKDRRLWKRQFAALRILERLDGEAVVRLAPLLKKHPFGKIQKWLRERKFEELRDVIHAEPGGYELVRIPGGSFMMGSPENEVGRFDNEGPQHEVTVPDFYMGRYPVTNEQYGVFIAENEGIKEPEFWSDRKYNQPSQPVVGVSWDEARKYAEWAGLQLPAEAQWEYACRAGTTTRYYTGDDEASLDRAGWYYRNSGGKLHPVGEKEPNALGLYDMHGNVWEWCEDDWHDNYKGAPTDGDAWIDEPRYPARVIRGGCWGHFARDCRSACRFLHLSGSDFVGIRLSRSVSL